jgi:chromosome segregation ATPase
MNQEQITDLIGRINRSNGNGFSYCELRALEDTINQLLFVRERTREAYARLKRINGDHQKKISEFYNANQEFTRENARLNENLAELRAQVTNHLAKIHEQEVVIQDLKARQWRVEVPCSPVTADEARKRQELTDENAELRKRSDHLLAFTRALNRRIDEQECVIRAQRDRLECGRASVSTRLLTSAEEQALQAKIKVLSGDLEDLRSRNQTQMITISKFQEDTARLRGDLAEIRRIAEAAE